MPLILCSALFIALRADVFFASAWDVSLNMKEDIIIALLSALILSAAVFVLLKKYPFIKRKKEYLLLSLSILISEGAVILSKELIIDYPFRDADIALPSSLLGTAVNVCIIIGAGVILGSFAYCLLYGLVIFVKDILKTVARIPRGVWIYIASVFAIINLFTYFYISQSKTVYFWDNAGYWATVNSIASSDSFSIPQILHSTYISVMEYDYNNVIILPFILLSKVFGPSRAVFVYGIMNMYVFPVYLLSALFSVKLFKKPLIPLVFSSLAVPCFIRFGHIGFVDCGGVIPLILAVFLFITAIREDKTEYIFLGGVSLAFSMILRRWFAFSAVGVITALLICSIVKKKPKYFILSVLSAGVPLVFFFQPFITNKLMQNYGEIYSAYKFDIKTDYFITVRYFGIAVLLLFIISSVILILRKRIGEGVFLLTSPIVTFGLFVSVQTHGQQHLLLYVPFILVSLMFLGDEISRHKKSAVLIPISLIISLTSFVWQFIPRRQPKSVSEISSHALFPDYSPYPERRNDTEELLRLCRYLDENIGEKGKTVGVLASSFVLNSDILMNTESSLNVRKLSDADRSRYIAYLPAVDKRDGFPVTILYCDYLIATDPSQIHLDGKDQICVSLPNEMMIRGECIASAFEPMEETFSLGEKGEVKVYVYKKVREITYEEIDAFCDAFAEYYPYEDKLFWRDHV